MPKFLAFDAALTTGWAYRENKFYESGEVRSHDSRNIGYLIEQAILHDVTEAVIEEPYLDRSKGVRTLMSLTESVVRIQVECERLGLKVRRVKATEWQSGMGITGQRDARKIGALRVASQLGGSPKSSNEADAICMCAWAERKFAMEELTKQRKRRARK